MPGFPYVLFPGKSANSSGLTDNCYYCTAAALLGKTLQELFVEGEMMQVQGGAFTEDIAALFNEVKENVIMTNWVSHPQLDTQVHAFLLTVTPGSGVGLEYRRLDGTQHMIVAIHDVGYVNNFVHPGIKCVDYQVSPPKVTGFPPEPNLIAYRIWYK